MRAELLDRYTGRYPGRLLALACLGALTLGLPAARLAHGQPAARPRFVSTAEHKVLDARRRQGPIRIDGRMDEADWAATPPGVEFTQRDPDDGEPAQLQTEF